ncbi:hypothetical protein CWATWH0005_587 [Crocosphaera watsonii WH 0005]|uniref:Uncharacterized protein n=1 Tax=Crocosphaera watsonii WH 0005 TaxID=423472 RepID=T2IPP9_CROWT|nr:hypothetical protein CWATWH0005_587 [Crocosphaera watsonii WH 0005]
MLAKRSQTRNQRRNPKSDDITLRFGLSKPRMGAGLKGEIVMKQHNKAFPKSIGHG